MDSVIKKKVFLVSSNLAGGGAEKIFTILLSEFDRAQFDFTLVLFNKKGEFLQLVPSDVSIIDLKKRSCLSFFILIFRLARLINKERPHVLVSTLIYANIITVFASLLSGVKQKVILSEQNYQRVSLRLQKRYHIKKWIAAYSYNRAHITIAPSAGVKSAMVEDYKINPARIRCIPNPVDLSKISSLSQEHISHPFFDVPEVPVIISVGRLEKIKNYELLLRSFAEAVKIKRMSLIVLGQGEEREKLLTLAGELRISDQVDFIGFRHNPYPWIRKAAVFVLSSLSEGFGNVIIEAMACGTAVVSTDCPSGPRDIITSGINGLLVPSNDIGLMKIEVLKLIENAALRRNIASQALLDVKKYDVSNILPQYWKELKA